MKIKNIFFMFNKLRHDLLGSKNPFDISDNCSTEQLEHYYFKFREQTSGLNKLIVAMDINGIPLNTSYIDVENKQPHYYPISIGQYGLAVFHSWLETNDAEKKEHFLRIANWFYENRTEDTRQGTFWLTNVPKPEYKVFAPWKSAFSQSRAISILLRAWQLTENNHYFEICKKALILFTIEITDGGVTANKKAGYPFYEEYVAEEPTMVLDGHIFSLFGLYDFIRAVPETFDKQNHLLAKKLFDEGIASLEYWLPKFDLGYWMRFNFCQMVHYPEVDPCTIGYLRLVQSQLGILFKLSGNPVLKSYQEKLQKYDRLVNILRMYPVKYNALKKLKRL